MTPRSPSRSRRCVCSMVPPALANARHGSALAGLDVRATLPLALSQAKGTLLLASVRSEGNALDQLALDLDVQTPLGWAPDRDGNAQASRERPGRTPRRGRNEPRGTARAAPVRREARARSLSARARRDRLSADGLWLAAAGRHHGRNPRQRSAVGGRAEGLGRAARRRRGGRRARRGRALRAQGRAARVLGGSLGAEARGVRRRRLADRRAHDGGSLRRGSPSGLARTASSAACCAQCPGLRPHPWNTPCARSAAASRRGSSSRASTIETPSKCSGYRSSSSSSRAPIEPRLAATPARVCR